MCNEVKCSAGRRQTGRRPKLKANDDVVVADSGPHSEVMAIYNQHQMTKATRLVQVPRTPQAPTVAYLLGARGLLATEASLHDLT